METFKGCLQYLVIGILLLAGAYFGINKWAANDESKKQKVQDEALAEVLSTEKGYLRKMVVAKIKPKVPYEGGAVILTGIIENRGDRDLASVTVALKLLKSPPKTVTRNFGPIKAGKRFEISEELPETKDRTHHMGENYDIGVTSIKFK